MAETTDELLLVERICGHLHAAHDGHLPVHVDELVLGNLDIEARSVRSVSAEGVFMELDHEGLGVRGTFVQLGRVRRGLDGSHERLKPQTPGESVVRSEQIWPRTSLR